MWLKHYSLQIFHHVIFTWKYFYSFRGNTCWSQKYIYHQVLISGEVKQRKFVESLIKTFNNFLRGTLGKKWGLSDVEKKITYLAKLYLSYLTQPHFCDTSKFILCTWLWPSCKLYLPTVCLTNFWLWFLFIISIWIRRQIR